MSQRLLSPLAYIVVDLILVAFTVLTVALSFVDASARTHLISGLAIGFVKASLVVLFFMHALRSPAQTKAVIAVTIFWLIAVLMALTFSDYLTRAWDVSIRGLPLVPGH